VIGCQDERGKEVKPTVERLVDGTYTVTYTPEEVAMYAVNVKYGGQQVPNAPFNIKTTPTGNANLVSATSMKSHSSTQIAYSSIAGLESCYNCRCQ